MKFLISLPCPWLNRVKCSIPAIMFKGATLGELPRELGRDGAELLSSLSFFLSVVEVKKKAERDDGDNENDRRKDGEKFHLLRLSPLRDTRPRRRAGDC